MDNTKTLETERLILRKFYNSAGFETEDAIGFWHKKI